ncbi:MAG: branched-chain amino acid ABC transporter substrate-binding protein [Chloroflexi bacterium]|nr:branched-chain amino acid ABC transporter substrate-binding protein [Chloroflexota bacterium]
MRKVLILLALTMLAPDLIGGCSPNATPQGEVIVYALAPLSGGQANGGQAIVGGVRVMAERINRQGGLLGKAIKVIGIDDQADSDVAADKAKDIAAAVKKGDKVIGVIGHANSGQTLAAMQVYKDLPLVVITPTASEVSLTQRGFRNFFRVNATDAAQAPALARFMVEQLKAQRVAVVHADNEYGNGLRDQMTAALKALGQTPVVVVKIKEAAPTYASFIPAIKAAQPDVVFLAGYETEGYVLLPELREAGVSAKFICSDGCFNSTYVDEAAPASEGTYVGAITPDPKVVGDKPWWQDYQRVEARNPDTYSVPGYSAMAVLAAGVQKAGTFEAAKVADAIRQLDMTTLVGHVTYDAGGDLKEQKVYIFQVKEGAFVQVFPK